MEDQLVVFTLENEYYAVGISSVGSIEKLKPIVAVPKAPSFVEGVTNLRGMVLPVIDLRKRFGLPEAEATKEARIIIAEVDETQQVGMIVDAVSEVLRVTEEDIEPTAPILTTVDSDFLAGIAKVEERLIMLLDLNKVLSTEEKADLQAIQVDASAEE